jgi:hypothetical protein
MPKGIRGFQPGNKLSSGGSHPELAGRKPNWWKSYCSEAVTSESRLKRLNHFLDKGSFQEFWAVFTYMSDQAFGKAQANVAVTADITQRRIIINMPPNCPKEYIEEANGI